MIPVNSNSNSFGNSLIIQKATDVGDSLLMQIATAVGDSLPLVIRYTSSLKGEQEICCFQFTRLLFFFGIPGWGIMD